MVALRGSIETICRWGLRGMGTPEEKKGMLQRKNRKDKCERKVE
jgi:hypothetical protein